MLAFFRGFSCTWQNVTQGGRGSENGHFCVTSFMNDPLSKSTRKTLFKQIVTEYEMDMKRSEVLSPDPMTCYHLENNSAKECKRACVCLKEEESWK